VERRERCPPRPVPASFDEAGWGRAAGNLDRPYPHGVPGKGFLGRLDPYGVSGNGFLDRLFR
jgi:hypothetical protein